MKKFLFAFFLLATITSNAQDNIIKINPLALVNGSDLLSFEKVITDRSSLILGAGISNFKFGDLKYQSKGAELQYRYYFDEVLFGWYAGGQVGYSTGKVELDDESLTYNSIKGGIKGGRQWIWDSGFSVDLNIGVAYNTFDYSETADPEIYQLSGIYPNLAVAIGYSF
jgi:hypothetical protein